jgi:hypothetical protein
MSQKVTPFMGGLGRDVTSKFEITDDASVTVGDGTNGGNVAVGDNGVISFGADSDLQIFHDGSDSILKENGTGGVLINNPNDLTLFDANGTGGVVKLFHVGGGVSSEKLRTTSSGIDVTGDVQGDGLIIDGTFDLGTL